MLLIIEGLDRTGKSSLAHSLVQDHKLDYRHFSKPEVHPLEEYERPLEHGPPRAVFDRFHLGEVVWPVVFQRQMIMDAAMVLHIELLLESRGAVLVRPWRPTEEIVEAARRDGEPAQGDDIWTAAHMFRLQWQRTQLPWFNWNLLEDSHATRQPFIQAAIRRAESARVLNGVTPRWIGHARPNVLLVGDEVRSGTDWTLPFVPYLRTSGHFLMEELIGSTIRPAIVNSRKPNGDPEPLNRLWFGLGKPRVVALGRRAESVLQKTNIPHGAVPHPQYVRRFLRSKGPGWYRDEIEREMT